MRILTVFCAALGGALAAVSALAQPFMGMMDPSWWQYAGRFTALSGDRAGEYSLYVHPSERSSGGETATAFAASVYDQQQLSQGHGSYWQMWESITFRCRENKYLTTSFAFYNKPQTTGTSADKLWEEQIPSADYSDVQPNSMGAAVMKIACS